MQHIPRENPSKNDFPEITIATSNNNDVPLITATKKHTPFKDLIIVKTISFAVNGLLIALYFTANGKLLAMIGEDEAAAGALASPYQGAILGASVGFTLATGLAMPPYLSKQDYRGAGNLIRTSWVFAGILGGISATAMLSTKLFFPLLFNPNTAKAATDFFLGSALGAIPTIMIVTNQQITFHEGEWYAAPLSSFLFTALSGAFSYLLAFQANLGALGVGLGGTLGQTVVWLAMQTWFLRSTYQKYHFYNLSKIPDFSKNLKKLLSMGWKLSWQRISEWANLMLIAIRIGIYSNDALVSTNAAIPYINSLAFAYQGLGHATGMLTKENNALIKQGMQQLLNANEIRNTHRKNITILVQNTIASVAISVSIAMVVYFAREPLASFFLPSSPEGYTTELAEDMLWNSVSIGLPIDALRIVWAGGLRGWDVLLYPTLVSILFMIFIGIPGGVGLGEGLESLDDKDPELSKASSMFYARNFTMFISALLIGIRCYKQISSDEKLITTYENKNREESTVITATQKLAPSGNPLNRYKFWSEGTKNSDATQPLLASPSPIFEKKKETTDEEIRQVCSNTL